MRIVNRLLVLLIGLALVALGVLAVMEAVAVTIGATPVLVDPAAVADSIDSAAWSDTGVMFTAAVLVLVGVILVVIELKPRRPVDYAAATSDQQTSLSYDRHGLTRLATQVAQHHPDIAEVQRATLHRRRLRLTAAGYADIDPVAVRRDVEQRVSARLDDLDLRRSPRLRVAVQLGNRRAR